MMPPGDLYFFYSQGEEGHTHAKDHPHKENANILTFAERYEEVLPEQPPPNSNGENPIIDIQ
jgi:hypothetical protein